MTETEENIKGVNLRSYKRKSMKHEIECGIRISINSNDIEELKSILGENRWELFDINCLNSCVVCEEQCNEGELAIEEVLFIPNKNGRSSDSLNRFSVELPRICCHECALDFSQRQSSPTPGTTTTVRSIGQAFKNFEERKEKSKENYSTSNTIKTNEDENNNNENNNGLATIPISTPAITSTTVTAPTTTLLPTSEAERDPFDDGFLICTQLVKTGGADQGGLQVGDVFVEFAHYTKKRFPGLKSIANMVRRSAGKEIPVVVWRKLEMNSTEDGTGRTVFQKLALKLKPLQSHDADGGGVLGAVINTYPLPEMRN